MVRPVSDNSSSRERARGRTQWTVRRYRLGEEPGDDLSETATVGERLAMMWPFAVQAWTLSGRSMPHYDRGNLPGRLYRRGEAPPPE